MKKTNPVNINTRANARTFKTMVEKIFILLHVLKTFEASEILEGEASTEGIIFSPELEFRLFQNYAKLRLFNLLLYSTNYFDILEIYIHKY